LWEKLAMDPKKVCSVCSSYNSTFLL
jgi:hypothetical protein